MGGLIDSLANGLSAGFTTAGQGFFEQFKSQVEQDRQGAVARVTAALKKQTHFDNATFDAVQKDQQRTKRVAQFTDLQSQQAHQRGIAALKAAGYEDAHEVTSEDIKAGDLEGDAMSIYEKAVSDPRGATQDAIRARQSYGDDKGAHEVAAADAAQTNSQANLAYKSAWGGVAERRSDIREKMVGIAERRADTAQQRADTAAANPLTKSQEVKNKEIDAARQRTADLTEEEIKLKTSKFTASGRANPLYNEKLAGALKLAGRRKFGDDPDFDGSPNDAGAADAQTSVLDRFGTDPAMAGMKPGRATPNGIEVFDKTGKLIGHYK